MLTLDPSQRRWLLRCATTLGAFILLAFVLYLRLPTYRHPPIDFYALKQGEIFNAYGLTRRQAGSVKLGFAEAFAPPDIAVYGNHIVEFFGADAFGRPEDAHYFFNYSYANLSLPEIHRFLRHLERLGHLPKRLMLVQVTPPNADNGNYIINWGNELPPDVLLSDLGRQDFGIYNGLRLASTASEVVSNWVHEVLNYNTFLWGLLQRGEAGRIVNPSNCRFMRSSWLDRVPTTLRSIAGGLAGRQFCEPLTWQGALRRDGSGDADLRVESEREPHRDAPLVHNEDPLRDNDRGLGAGDDVEIAAHMRAIESVGRRNDIKVVFIVPPVYETDRRDSVVNQIFNRALARIPDIAVIDDRDARTDPTLFKSSIHPSPKYYRSVADKLRGLGLVE